MQTAELAKVERIEGKINAQTLGGIAVSPTKGMAVSSMDQAMEVAKLMSVSGSAVPRHLRGNPGACLAVAIQGWEWGINPFAIANKSYEVNDRLGYESAIFHAVVVKRAPIVGRIRSSYSGVGAQRSCRVEATLTDGTGNVDYTSPVIGDIKPQNSPLWKGDPDQQLFYYSVRAFARRHFPDVMMGIVTTDELIDAPPEAPERNAKGLTEKLAATPVVVERRDNDVDEDIARHVEAVVTSTEAASMVQVAADNLPTNNEAIENGDEGKNADELRELREALSNVDAAKKAIIDKVRERLPNMTRKEIEGELFRFSRNVGSFDKTSVEQRVDLWRQVIAGTWPAAK